MSGTPPSPGYYQPPPGYYQPPPGGYAPQPPGGYAPPPPGGYAPPPPGGYVPPPPGRFAPLPPGYGLGGVAAQANANKQGKGCCSGGCTKDKAVAITDIVLTAIFSLGLFGSYNSDYGTIVNVPTVSLGVFELVSIAASICILCCRGKIWPLIFWIVVNLIRFLWNIIVLIIIGLVFKEVEDVRPGSNNNAFPLLVGWAVAFGIWTIVYAALGILIVIHFKTVKKTSNNVPVVVAEGINPQYQSTYSSTAIPPSAVIQNPPPPRSYAPLPLGNSPGGVAAPANANKQGKGCCSGGCTKNKAVAITDIVLTVVFSLGLFGSHNANYGTTVNGATASLGVFELLSIAASICILCCRGQIWPLIFWIVVNSIRFLWNILVLIFIGLVFKEAQDVREQLGLGRLRLGRNYELHLLIGWAVGFGIWTIVYVALGILIVIHFKPVKKTSNNVPVRSEGYSPQYQPTYSAVPPSAVQNPPAYD